MNCNGVVETFLYLFSSDPAIPSLLYYTHIPVAIITLILGFFVYKNNKNSLAGKVLFGLNFSIFLMIFANIVAWVNSDVSMVIYSWSINKILYLIVPILSVYLFYVLTKNRDVSHFSKVITLLIVSAYSFFNLSSKSVVSFDLVNCELNDQPVIAYIQVFFIFICVVSLLVLYLKSLRADSDRIKRVTSSIFFFSILFFILNLFFIYQLAYYFEYYEYELYALIGLPIFIGAITFTIVKYKTFNIKLVGAQALMWALVILIGSQFFFIQVTINYYLTGFSLLGAIIVGSMIVRNVKREIAQKEEMARLAKSLEIAANKLEATNLSLQTANEKLKELDAMKSEFVSLATHQIRGPLAAIKGYISMVMEGDYGEVPPTIKDPLSVVFKSTDSLSQMVTDYLDVSRIDLGQMKYDFTEFDFKDLVQEVTKEFEPGIVAKGLEFKVDVKDQIYPVKVDRVKIKQVLNNIIDNASKYTKQGSIRVSLERLNDKVLFAVKDTGVGISAGTMPLLFQRFSRAKNANDTNILGTGLGLYVARKMVEANNGRIWAQSEGEGKGSQFYVEISCI